WAWTRHSAMAEIKSITINFSRSPDYRVIAANGALGGPAAQGVILVDFFVERIAAPLAITQQFTGGQPVEHHLVPNVDRTIEREAQIGMMLTPEAARSIGEWLISKADDCEAIQGKRVGRTDASDDPEDHSGGDDGERLS